jgi:hypothetical protein
LIHTAYSRTPSPNQRGGSIVLDVPMLFLNRSMINAVALVSLLSLVGEIWYGVKIIGWWTLGVWFLGLVPATILFPGKNPGPCFFISLPIAAVGFGMLLLAKR